MEKKTHLRLIRGAAGGVFIVTERERRSLFEKLGGGELKSRGRKLDRG